MAQLKEQSVTIFNYVKEHDGEDFTCKDIAKDIFGDEGAWRKVSGTVLSFQRRKDAEGNETPVMYREKAQIQDEDGKYKDVTFIRLTDYGKEATVESLNAEDAKKNA